MRVPVAVLSLALIAGAANAAPGEASRDFERGRHVLLRASAPLTEADRAELAEKGIVVQRVAAGGRYVAHVARNAESDARVAVEPLTAESKIQPSAFRAAAHGDAYAAMHVYFHDDVSLDDARTAIAAAGGALEDAFATEFAPMRQLTAKIAPQSLAALAADDRVLMISGVRHFDITTHNATSAAVSHVTEVQTAPYGLTGAGVAVSLFELAEGQASHVEFGGRLNVFSTGGSSGNKAHATHTAGTIGAAGVRSDAKGMAPGATLYEFCVEDPSNTCTTKWITEKDRKLAPLGVVADNNSWGFVIGWSAAVAGFAVWDDNAEYFGAYDYEFSAPLDQISRDRNVLFVHSSGNEADDVPPGEWAPHRHRDSTNAVITTETFCYSKDGSGNDCPKTTSPQCTTCEIARHHALAPFDTLSLTGAAKNVIAVGAVDTSRTILGLSSRGPAKDGRVKPDVVARGANVLSSVPTNSYASNNGTSMAAPVVTGIAALLTEQWRRTFARTPKPEELKALIIAGADDLGNPGPDYTYGFGLADAKSAVDLILADHADNNHIRSASIAQGQRYEMPIVVDSTRNVRVVLQWPDPPIFLPESQVSTANALVNNLDLKIIGPTGTAYLPYVLDKTNPGANATRGVNLVDNTEEVEIANAAPGAYRIVVDGAAVPQGPQSAVIVTTARGARPCRDIQEPNNSADSAWGNIVPESKIAGGFCAAGDIDFYKFQVTKSSAMSVDVTTGDTPLRVTLSSNQVTATVDVPAYSSRTLQAGSVVPQTNVTLKFEPTSAPGVEPDYTFTPHFGQDPGVRRRSARH
jgi:subtilisin family serine protease